MSSIDYFAGVFKERSEQDVLRFLGRVFGGFVLGRGSHGYKQCWMCEGVRVYFDGGAGMGVYVQLSGQGCAVLSVSPYFVTWGEYASEWLEFGGSFNRIDIAYDDREGVCLFETIARQADEGEYTSRFRNVSISEAMHEGAYTKRVRYFGSMESDCSLCVYDKRLEQLAKAGDDPGHWVRFELRFKGKQAAFISSWLIEHPTLEGSEEFLRSAVEFRDSSGDSNKRRQEPSGWWLRFLGNCGKMRVTVLPPSRSLAERALRFAKQHAATLAMLVLSLCEGRMSGKWLSDLIITGWGRMSVSQCKVVRDSLGYVPGQGPLLNR